MEVRGFCLFRCLSELQPWLPISSEYRVADNYIGPSRCFPFWQEVLACYVVNTNEEDISGAKKCMPALEDYYECLHHKKEVGLRLL